VEDHYRVIFYSLIDYATLQLGQRFHENCDIHMYKVVEEVLLTGEGTDQLRIYPELNNDLLSAQLKMFHSSQKQQQLTIKLKITKTN
jgi:hypothetical protein